MNRAAAVICILFCVILTAGCVSVGDSGSQTPVVEKPVAKEYGFGGFEGVFKSKDESAGLWVDASGYGILLDDDSIVAEGELVPVSADSFKIDGVLITFNAQKDLVAFGGLGGTVLHRDTDF